MERNTDIHLPNIYIQVYIQSIQSIYILENTYDISMLFCVISSSICSPKAITTGLTHTPLRVSPAPTPPPLRTRDCRGYNSAIPVDQGAVSYLGKCKPCHPSLPRSSRPSPRTKAVRACPSRQKLPPRLCEPSQSQNQSHRSFRSSVRRREKRVQLMMG